MVGTTFLDWVWDFSRGSGGPLYGEIRGLGSDLDPIQIFVPLGSSELALELSVADAGADNRDVYFGVLPRVRQSGTAADVSLVSRVLWADVDAKMHDHSKGKALTALLSMSPIPQAIVDSGGGYHAYWKLSAPIEVFRAVEMMKGIASRIGGDHTYDAPRILRVPGTRNHKYAGWPEARLIRLDTTRLYKPADFEAVEPVRQPQGGHAFIPGSWSTDWTNNPNRRKDLDPWLVELLNSAPEKGSRSEAAFKAGLWLWRYGYTPEEIERIFEEAPIGEKYREEGNGHRWFLRMLSKFS